MLLGVSVLFNYFDRLALSVAGPPLRQELHLDALTLGVLFSAFSWSYVVLQIPSGMILDRFGVTRVGRIGITLWGVTGAIVDATGSFAVAFVVAAAVLLAGVCFYGLLMGRIEPVPDLPGRDAALATTGVRIAE